jgi:hypothetical protein
VIPQSAGSDPGPCTAPAALLVQDALHRTESLSGAIDWCLHRPAGGRATLLFGDASGQVAGLRVDGDARRLLRPADGLVVEARGAERGAEIAKRLREGVSGNAADGLMRALGAAAVVLDPGGRRLLHRGGGTPEEVRL